MPHCPNVVVKLQVIALKNDGTILNGMMRNSESGSESSQQRDNIEQNYSHHPIRTDERDENRDISREYQFHTIRFLKQYSISQTK